MIIFDWARSWVPLGTQIFCGYSGNWFFEPIITDTACEASDLIVDRNILILLGDPGSGKTTEFSRLKEIIKGSPGVTLSFRAAGMGASPATTIGQSAPWQKSQSDNEDLTLMIDGIDEVLVSYPFFLDEIIEFIKNHHTAKLRVILSLRAGAWGEKYEKELLPTFKVKACDAVFELCPLTRQDAEKVFHSAGSDQPLEDFLKWLQERDHAPLARLPIFIEQLVKDFVNNPNEPFSLQNLRLRNIERLLLPASDRESKTTDLSQDRLLSLASLIAVHTILAGQPDFYISDQEIEQSDMLNLTSFFNAPFNGTWECRGEAFTVSKKDLETLLERPLFTATKVGEHTIWRFAHLTFSEVLTAKVLDDQPIARLLQILGVDSIGQVAPQNERLTAMLATNSTSLRKWLLKNQPLTLLRSDATQIPEEEHASIVQASLDYIDSSEENIRLSYSQIERGFNTDDACQVLIRKISSGQSSVLVKLAALEIASRCLHPRLADPTYEVISNNAEDKYVRKAAVDAWIEIAGILPDPPKEDALKIASGEVGTGNPQNCGDALRFLAKIGVPLRELLPITPSDEPNCYGTLHRFLDHDVPRIIELADLPAALDFLDSLGQSRTYDYRLNSLSEETYLLAVKHLDEDEVMRIFAAHWWSPRNIRANGSLERSLRPQIESLTPIVRARFIETLLRSPLCPSDHPHFAIPVFEDDVRWLVESLPSQSDPVRHHWLQLIRFNYRSVIEEQIPDWLSKAYSAGEEDFRAVFPNAKSGKSLQDIFDREKKEVRALRAKEKREQKNFQRKHRPYTQKKFLENCRKGFRDHPSNTWIHFATYVHHRFSENASAEDYNPAHRIKNSLNWKSLAEDDQEMACSAARQFLAEIELPHPRNGNTYADLAAYKALDLLRNEITPTTKLGSIFKERWTQSIAPQFNNGEINHQELMKLCKELDPDDFQNRFRRSLTQSLMGKECPLLLRAYPLSWDDSGSRILVEEVLKVVKYRVVRTSKIRRRIPKGILGARKKIEQRRAEAILFAFHFLADHDPNAAKDLVWRLVDRCYHPRAAAGTIEASVLLHALMRFPDLWESIWAPLIRIPVNHLRTGFVVFANNLDRDYFKSPWTDSLADNQITSLYCLHDSLFPKASIHRTAGNERVLSPNDPHIEFEYAVRETLKKRGMAGEIIDMMNELISKERRDALRWILREAKETAAKAMWSPPTNGEVSKWLHSSDAVLVRTAGDLLKATMISLQRYQDHLAGEFLVADCWVKEPKKDGKKQNYRPSLEEDLSLRIKQFLSSDLKNVVITREGAVRVGPSENRTDIEVSIPTSNGPITIIIEHKRAHNTGVATSMETQLVNRYMATKDCDHGIYLVSWFDGFPKAHKPITNALGVSSPLEARSKLAEQAVNLKITTNKEVEVIILDCCLNQP